VGRIRNGLPSLFTFVIVSLQSYLRLAMRGEAQKEDTEEIRRGSDQDA
jgi:hypothetical protein